MHASIAAIYDYAAGSNLEQFRPLALAQLTQALDASGAFWGLYVGDDQGMQGRIGGVVRIGDTPGHGSDIESIGAINPLWPAKPPIKPVLFKNPGNQEVAKAAGGALSFCRPLPAARGFQLVNIYGLADGGGEETRSICDALAFHATKGFEIAMRQACRSASSMSKSAAIIDQVGWIIYATHEFQRALCTVCGLTSDACALRIDGVDGVGSRVGGRLPKGLQLTVMGSLSLMTVEEAPELAALSHRELSIARLAATGQTDKEISEQLGLARSTVSNHITNVLKKTGATSRRQLKELIPAS